MHRTRIRRVTCTVLIRRCNLIIVMSKHFFGQLYAIKLNLVMILFLGYFNIWNKIHPLFYWVSFFYDHTNVHSESHMWTWSLHYGFKFQVYPRIFFLIKKFSFLAFFGRINLRYCIFFKCSTTYTKNYQLPPYSSNYS